MTTAFDGNARSDEFDPSANGRAFGGGEGDGGFGGPGGAASDLSAFDDDYDEVEAPSYDVVPDGKYQVRVQRVELGRSQAGDPMLKWDLVVLSGASGGHAGRHIFKNSVITHRSLPYVKGDLLTLGVRLAKFSELPHRLEELLDVTLEITKRTRRKDGDEFANVYFNRRIEIPSGGESDLGTEPAPF